MALLSSIQLFYSNFVWPVNFSVVSICLFYHNVIIPSRVSVAEWSKALVKKLSCGISGSNLIFPVILLGLSKCKK